MIDIEMLGHPAHNAKGDIDCDDFYWIALAQAEQLERIANALERIAESMKK